MRIVIFVALAFGLVSACNDFNRPAPVPHSEPRHNCFSDVECPKSNHCEKTPNEIQGTCADALDTWDSGTPSSSSDGGALAPAPTVQPSAGDVHI